MRSTVHRTIILALLLVSTVALSEISTQTPQPRLLQIEPSNPRLPQRPDSETTDMLRDMEKKANKQRQADLKRDTDKLLKLSTELKEYVDKTNENVLSLDVIKKADEIEKLAHSVKVKMRGEQYGAPTLPQ
jgi:hypothetical protein